MLLNIDKWRELLSGIETERNKVGIQLRQILGETSNQNTLFDVSLINLDSPIQVVKALNKLGINVKSTDVKELKKYGNSPVVKLLLEYRKHEKFLTTYGEALIERVHFKTGRLHSDFRQMVATGRLSSSNPNLQNIPSEKIYRACFVAQPGHNLVTCDMSQAELRILAAYSKDPVFLEAFEKGLDLHARTAADLFGVTYEEVLADKKLSDDDPNKKHYRSHVKALNFGLCIKEGTEILTVNGLVPIENIKLGDVVIHDIGQDEVIDFKFMGYKKTVCLELDNGYKLIVTPDHIVKVICNNVYMDKAIKELNKSDFVCIMNFNNLVIETSRIKAITDDSTYRVYDISVNNHPYYIANGVVVHNCYGLTKVGLAIRMGVSEEKAQKLIDQYFSKYTRVAKWLEAAGKFALQNGYALTRSGRRRHFKVPEPSNPEYNRLKGHIERQGKNTPIQGCLVNDTIIDNKWYIEDLVGKTICLSNGKTAYGVYSGKKDVWILKLSNGQELGITLNHKIPVLTESGIVIDKLLIDIDIYSDLLLISVDFSKCNSINLFSNMKNYETCRVVGYEYKGIEKVYDLICDGDPHYYIANGVVLHNSNADTIKQAMVYIVDRIDKAKLLSTVHDEVIVEAKKEDVEEVAYEVSKALCDGFAEFVPEVQMKADAIIKDYWSKD